jgi:hypothetical protein
MARFGSGGGWGVGGGWLVNSGRFQDDEEESHYLQSETTTGSCDDLVSDPFSRRCSRR